MRCELEVIVRRQINPRRRKKSAGESVQLKTLQPLPNASLKHVVGLRPSATGP
jgi:hypothetical protein